MMTPVSVECPVCRQPLPLGEPVALVEKQQLIHVGCYRPAPAPRTRTRSQRTAGRNSPPLAGRSE